MLKHIMALQYEASNVIDLVTADKYAPIDSDLYKEHPVGKSNTRNSTLTHNFCNHAGLRVFGEGICSSPTQQYAESPVNPKSK